MLIFYLNYHHYLILIKYLHFFSLDKRPIFELNEGQLLIKSPHPDHL